CMQGREFPWTF
nr:immunoglobulin light chain junction region [Macaca mulatta]MOX58300.1 immunoglobulin light chain junction region [Macaca mulatta]MOX84707.1 immunoglobulin light chain junction region [Macaca mulatta]MOX84751.1 immunoglobulin light chain junction region [Macaca mulatta]MOX84815.1 immunoglobulin light chain junction region [Macaca mulatta]